MINNNMRGDKKKRKKRKERGQSRR